jgi:antitoxin PrlF
MKITSKGQIPLPPEVIEKLGFLPDTEIEYVIEGEILLLRKSRQIPTGKQLIASLRGTANSGLSTDEIMKLTRGD